MTQPAPGPGPEGTEQQQQPDDTRSDIPRVRNEAPESVWAPLQFDKTREGWTIAGMRVITGLMAGTNPRMWAAALSRTELAAGRCGFGRTEKAAFEDLMRYLRPAPMLSRVPPPELLNCPCLLRYGRYMTVAPALQPLLVNPRTPEDVAAWIAASDEPATHLFERWLGTPLRVSVAVRTRRRLSAAEGRLLRADEGTPALYRLGCLMPETGGEAVATVSSLVVLDRLPAAALEQVMDRHCDVPLGKILHQCGAVREHLAALTDRGQPHTSARLWIGSKPAALAWEQVSTWFVKDICSKTC